MSVGAGVLLGGAEWSSFGNCRWVCCFAGATTALPLWLWVLPPQALPSPRLVVQAATNATLAALGGGALAPVAAV